MVTFVESPLFTKQVHDYLTDIEYGVFQEYLATNPDMGEPYYRIATIYLKQQHPAQARAMFAKALALGPDAEYMRDAKKQLASLDASLSSDSAARYNKSK